MGHDACFFVGLVHRIQNSFWANTGVGDQYFMCQILVHNIALDLLLFKSGKSRVLDYSHDAIRISLALECYVTDMVGLHA